MVEDDPLLHSLLADKLTELREKGVEVTAVMNGKEALEKSKEIKPNLILLDLVIPEMNGFEFLEALRAEPDLKDTRVVILSNLSSDEDKERARLLGVIAYIVKADFSPSKISEVVEEVLQGHAAPKAEGGTPSIKKTESGNYMVYL